MDLTLLERVELPPVICGIYFLMRGDQVVYIGQSINVVSRVCTHMREGKKNFDHFRYMPCDFNDLDKIEASFISMFDPEYNSTMPPGFGFYSVHQWSNFYDVPVRLLRAFIEKSGLLPQKKWYPECEICVFVEFMNFCLGKRWQGRRKRIDFEKLETMIPEFLIQKRA